MDLHELDILLTEQKMLECQQGMYVPWRCRLGSLGWCSPVPRFLLRAAWEHHQSSPWWTSHRHCSENPLGWAALGEEPSPPWYPPEQSRKFGRIGGCGWRGEGAAPCCIHGCWGSPGRGSWWRHSQCPHPSWRRCKCRAPGDGGRRCGVAILPRPGTSRGRCRGMWGWWRWRARPGGARRAATGRFTRTSSWTPLAARSWNQRASWAWCALMWLLVRRT